MSAVLTFHPFELIKPAYVYVFAKNTAWGKFGGERVQIKLAQTRMCGHNNGIELDIANKIAQIHWCGLARAFRIRQSDAFRDEQVRRILVFT